MGQEPLLGVGAGPWHRPGGRRGEAGQEGGQGGERKAERRDQGSANGADAGKKKKKQNKENGPFTFHGGQRNMKCYKKTNKNESEPGKVKLRVKIKITSSWKMRSRGQNQGCPGVPTQPLADPPGPALRPEAGASSSFRTSARRPQRGRWRLWVAPGASGPQASLC